MTTPPTPDTPRPDPALLAQKAELRQSLLESLRAIELTRRHEASSNVCGRVLGLEAFARADTVMLYMPLRSEIDVMPVALRCFQLGKSVCLPRVIGGHEMLPVETSSFDDHAMEFDEVGMLTPRNGAPMPLEQVDLVVVPGLAYDLHGRRLGRGGGHYDRFLPRLRRSATLVGVAFDLQVIDEVPDGRHDVRVDILASERRTIYTGAARIRA